MTQPHITSNNRTNWSSKQETVSQPNQINYDDLLKKISNQNKDDKRINREGSIVRKDLRKLSFSNNDVSNEIDEHDEIKKLDKESIIPIPGLSVDILENNDGYSGKSTNWNDVNNNQLTNGPQWNPMTF